MKGVCGGKRVERQRVDQEAQEGQGQTEEEES